MNKERDYVPPDPLMTTKEAAMYLNLHPQTLKEKAERKEVPTAGKVGNRWRYRKSAIDRWLANRES